MKTKVLIAGLLIASLTAACDDPGNLQTDLLLAHDDGRVQTRFSNISRGDCIRDAAKMNEFMHIEGGTFVCITTPPNFTP